MRVAVFINQPTPYRDPVFAAIAADPQIDLRVFYLSRQEPDRDWDLAALPDHAEFLPGRIIALHKTFVHLNVGVLARLRRFRPRVVVTAGFGPTQLTAFAWSLLTGTPHVVHTDGTARSEEALSATHRLVRRVVFARTAAFIGAGAGSRELFARYGVAVDRMFDSPLAVDNERFARPPHRPEEYDLLFSGRLEALKGIHFAIDVAERTSQLLRRPVRMAVAGGGRLEEEVRSRAASTSAARITMLGFQQQDDLPSAYHSAKILLMPTRSEPWGLVINEACAASTAVIASPGAHAAVELGVHDRGGLVLPLDVGSWADAAADLLTDDPRLRAMQEAGPSLVRRWTFQTASDGYRAAIAAAARPRASPRRRRTASKRQVAESTSS